MSETSDPRLGLGSPDTAARAAAARDLEKAGTWADIPQLVAVAAQDRSPSVRHGAAVAAAEIAWRARPLAPARQAEIHAWVKPVDPGINPGILLLLAAAGDDDALARLGRMIRDPRNDVRQAVVFAIRRLALAVGSAGDPGLRAAVAGWFAARVPADTAVELARLAGEAGWTECAPAIRKLSGLGKAGGGVVDEALARLSALETEAGFAGLYLSDGADVFDPPTGADLGSAGWWLVGGGRFFDAAGDRGPVVVAGGRITAPVEARLVWAPRVGETGRFAAMQCQGLNGWRVEGAVALTKAAEDLVLQLPAAGALALRELLAESESAPAQRARAILSWRAGDLATAKAGLEAALAAKKPRPETWYWLARVCLDAGDRPGAIAALDAFLERVGKRAEHRDDAERLRGTL